MPDEFDIEYSMTRDFGPPMNDIAIYMTAVKALENLCFRDQNAAIPGNPRAPFESLSVWSSPVDDIYLEISSLSVRYAVWALQLTAGNIGKRGWWPVIARYSWLGDFVGRLDLGNEDSPLPQTDGDLSSGGKLGSSNQTAVTSSAELMTNITTANNLVDGARLTINPTYRGLPLSPRSVFGIAIDIMVLGAEYGPNTYCLSLQRTGVEVIGLNDAGGEPLLKYKSLIRTMGILMPWMVAMQRYGEIDVEIRRDSVLVGKLRIKSRRSSGFGLD